MYIDTHIHTCFSGDSDTPVRAQIERAIALGMPVLCITDHQDFDFPPGGGLFEFDTEAYLKELLLLREEYASRIDLRIGAELGLQCGIPTDLEAYFAAWPFDYVIGSTHVCMGMDPYYPELYEIYGEDAAYRKYFEIELENYSAYNCYHCAGHLDYVVRYGPNKNQFYSYQKYADVLDEILRVLVQKGKGLECNTSGFKAGLGHPNPTEDILKRYRELGGEIVTLGSDAHRPEHVGYAFDLVGDLLKSCGFRYYAVFKDGKPQFLPL